MYLVKNNDFIRLEAIEMFFSVALFFSVNTSKNLPMRYSLNTGDGI